MTALRRSDAAHGSIHRTSYGYSFCGNAQALIAGREP
jgi:hypothetical protein